MPRLVMKFGGTSVANVDRIRNVAAHVAREVAAGYEVAVVVSAMSGKTNELVAWVKDADPLYDAAEYDPSMAHAREAQQLLEEVGDRVGAGLAVAVHASCLANGHGYNEEAARLVEPWWAELRDRAGLLVRIATEGLHVGDHGERSFSVRNTVYRPPVAGQQSGQVPA